MIIGVPAEVKNNEYRVAITPIGVHELVAHGHEVVIQAGAGTGSSITDDDYVAAGARMLPDADAVWGTAEMVLKVKEPVAEEYHRNVYGESTSELHRGTPTDRLVAQWHITEPHVERRLQTPEAMRVTSAEIGSVPTINRTAERGAFRACEALDLAMDAPRLWLEIPVGWTELQRDEPEMAMAWRLQTREVFEAYFARGYRVVDFTVRREDGVGRYLLADRTRVGMQSGS